jgi:hypothetical protein
VAQNLMIEGRNRRPLWKRLLFSVRSRGYDYAVRCYSAPKHTVNQIPP